MQIYIKPFSLDRIQPANNSFFRGMRCAQTDPILEIQTGNFLCKSNLEGGENSQRVIYFWYISIVIFLIFSNETTNYVVNIN